MKKKEKNDSQFSIEQTSERCGCHFWIKMIYKSDIFSIWSTVWSVVAFSSKKCKKKEGKMWKMPSIPWKSILWLRYPPTWSCVYPIWMENSLREEINRKNVLARKSIQDLPLTVPFSIPTFSGRRCLAIKPSKLFTKVSPNPRFRHRWWTNRCRWNHHHDSVGSMVADCYHRRHRSNVRIPLCDVPTALVTGIDCHSHCSWNSKMENDSNENISIDFSYSFTKAKWQNGKMKCFRRLFSSSFRSSPPI